MLEMLVALAILLLLMTNLLPLYVHIKAERRNLELSSIASKLLHEKALEYKYDNLSASSMAQNVSGVLYEITWNEQDSPLLKICVSWTDFSARNWERCDFIKR